MHRAETSPYIEPNARYGKIAKKQGTDGSFGDDRWGRSVAITSLAGIAFMADGNLPGRGPYGDNVEKALKHVLENCTESGLVAGDTAAAPMYGHGFATLFLCEIYGMTGGGPDAATLPRDTIYAAVMIICTGVVGICLLAGGLSHHAQSFQLAGTSPALSALVALAGLSLVLPTFTTSSAGASGLILAGSPPRSAIASRMVARSNGLLM